MENATLQQNNDSKRKSESNDRLIEKRTVSPINSKKLFYDENEILIRQNLNLHPLYLDKLKTYFKE